MTIPMNFLGTTGRPTSLLPVEAGSALLPIGWLLGWPCHSLSEPVGKRFVQYQARVQSRHLARLQSLGPCCLEVAEQKERDPTPKKRSTERIALYEREVVYEFGFGYAFFIGLLSQRLVRSALLALVPIVIHWSLKFPPVRKPSISTSKKAHPEKKVITYTNA